MLGFTSQAAYVARLDGLAEQFTKASAARVERGRSAEAARLNGLAEQYAKMMAASAAIH